MERLKLTLQNKFSKTQIQF